MITVATALWVSTIVTGAPVLGAEAAAPVQRWVAALDGLATRGASIDRATIRVRVGDGACRLRLDHRSAAPCADAVEVGDARACWEGEGCPDAAARAAALRAAGPLSLPWRDTGAGGPAASPARDTVLAAHDTARRALEIGDREAARAALEAALVSEGVRAVDRMSIIPMAAHAGARRAAWTAATHESMGDLGPGLEAALRLTLLVGPDLGARAAEALTVADPGSGCGVARLARAWLSARAVPAVAVMASAARAADATCFEAYAAESEAWSILRRADRQREVGGEAMRRFAGDSRLAPIEEALLMASGKGDVVQKRLEARVAAGDRSAGVLKRLLPFYIDPEGRPERLKRFLARADANPDDDVAAFFVGVVLHYERDYARSQRYLRPLEVRIAEEPRLYIYLAMNAFNLGDRPGAERWIAKAGELDLRDPDVPYCISEIYRDSDRAKALAALDKYWSMTAFSSDPTSVKQRRVAGMRVAIQACYDAKTPAPCPGPWEHTFDSVRLKQEQEQAAAPSE